jgi:HK97 family phage major capsid protein
MDILTMKRERLALRGKARNMIAKAETRDGMSDDENGELEKIMARIDELEAKIAAMTAKEEASEEEDKEKEEKDGDEDKKDKEESSRRSPKMSFENRYGDDGGKGRDSKQYRNAFSNYLRTGVQHRDLSLGDNAAGGYLVTPTKMSKDLVIALNNMVFLRQFADIESVDDAKSLGVPKVSTDISDADWTSEVPSSYTADSSMATGRRDLTPNLLVKLALVSHRLVMASSNVEKVVVDRLAYKNGVAQEKAFLTGNGSGKPLGIFYASSDGISTGQDKAAASGTVFTADELIDTLYKIPQQYQKSPSFRWIMHRDTVARCRKLKDGNGNYVWQLGIQAGQPDTILGVPVLQSEYAPNTFTSGLYVAAVGDLKYYKIAETNFTEIQRLNERYIDTNQIGFLSRSYLDASPVLENAFARLKLG